MRAVLPVALAALLGVAFTVSLTSLSSFTMPATTGLGLQGASGPSNLVLKNANSSLASSGQDLQTIGSLSSGKTVGWELLVIVAVALSLAFIVSVVTKRRGPSAKPELAEATEQGNRASH
jgi:hypothetical protein